VVVLRVSRRWKTGLGLVQAIRAAHPDGIPKVLVVCSVARGSCANQFFLAGADGYATSANEIPEAIDDLLEGRLYLSEVLFDAFQTLEGTSKDRLASLSAIDQESQAVSARLSACG
jgi:DNA-binding NarL/FixJ family response regulator